jgi:hypothetical protein
VVDAVVSTGGTGLTGRDVTPEALSLIEGAREIQEQAPPGTIIQAARGFSSFSTTMEGFSTASLRGTGSS